MTCYQHNFDRIEDYLHHRRPYLVVDEIVELEMKAITTRATVPSDAFYIEGHFPGAPILPGAMMQEMTTQSAGVLIAARYNPMSEFNTHDPHFNKYALGVLVKVRSARYKNFARPGDQLEIRVELEDQLDPVFNFRASIQRDGKKLMQNRFQLMNILSEQLTQTSATS